MIIKKFNELVNSNNCLHPKGDVWQYKDHWLCCKCWHQEPGVHPGKIANSDAKSDCKHSKNDIYQYRNYWLCCKCWHQEQGIYDNK